MSIEQETGSGMEKKRNAPLWVKIFVPFHLLAITVWALPYAPSQFVPTKTWVNGELVTQAPRVPLGVKLDSVTGFFQSLAQFLANEPLVLNQIYGKDSALKFYCTPTGFWQFWDMFSPNPASTDVYVDALVTYRDGTVQRYEYPRIYKLGIGMKYVKERYRKFAERAAYPQYQYAWPAFAQNIARGAVHDQANPPTQVSLHIHKLDVAPPGEVQRSEYSDEEYFKYFVKPVDLDGMHP